MFLINVLFDEPISILESQEQSFSLSCFQLIKTFLNIKCSMSPIKSFQWSLLLLIRKKVSAFKLCHFIAKLCLKSGVTDCFSSGLFLPLKTPIKQLVNNMSCSIIFTSGKPFNVHSYMLKSRIMCNQNSCLQLCWFVLKIKTTSTHEELFSKTL